MHVTHYARQSLAAAILALALAACGKDNGPSEFNPQGTSADMAAAQDAFASEQTASFSAVGEDISAVLNGSPVVAGTAELMLTGPSPASARFARRLAALVPSASRGIQASVAAVPSAVLGTTFVWDETSHAYVASDRPGAPSSGVRFVLYAVSPVTFRPAEPVVEVGYVDITDHSTSTAIDVGVRVVQGSVVYLDYNVKVTATASGGLVTVSGTASDGTTAATFILKNTVSANAGSPIYSFDYQLDVPSRHLSLDWTATLANISDTEVAITLDLAISGQNGDVRITGTEGASAGNILSVKVNGDLLATVNLDGVDPVVTGAGGASLTPEEEASLQAILEFYAGSWDVFASLLLPVPVS
jgi:predicted small lipoprotein YifL